MRDVLARLMQWMETSDIDDADIVLREAITEIAGLRARLDEHRLAIRRLAEQDATLRGLLSRMGDCPTPDNAADRDSGTTGHQ